VTNILKFNWKVKYQLIRPDGEGKDPYIVLGVDDGSGVKNPAPSLVVKEGDELEIVVTNLCGYPISMHFHGFDQVGTMFADGASSITQWPIPNKSSYRHKFKATVPGTFFYHG